MSHTAIWLLVFFLAISLFMPKTKAKGEGGGDENLGGEHGDCEGGVCRKGVWELGPEGLEEYVRVHDVVVVNFCDTESGKCRSVASVSSSDDSEVL